MTNKNKGQNRRSDIMFEVQLIGLAFAVLFFAAMGSGHSRAGR